MKHKENYDQAIVSFNNVIRINPNNVNALTMRGVAFSSLDQFDAALSR
jgi:Flp pilus assembly protein TadD